MSPEQRGSSSSRVDANAGCSRGGPRPSSPPHMEMENTRNRQSDAKEAQSGAAINRSPHIHPAGKLRDDRTRFTQRKRSPGRQRPSVVLEECLGQTGLRNPTETLPVQDNVKISQDWKSALFKTPNVLESTTTGPF